MKILLSAALLPAVLAVVSAAAADDDKADYIAGIQAERAKLDAESYPVGRYVRLRSGEDGAWVLDFNLAGNPNCAYNLHWNCPIPPKENVLGVAIRAGERPYLEPSDP